jgi:hypothetical protein
VYYPAEIDEHSYFSGNIKNVEGENGFGQNRYSGTGFDTGCKKNSGKIKRI